MNRTFTISITLVISHLCLSLIAFAQTETTYKQMMAKLRHRANAR